MKYSSIEHVLKEPITVPEVVVGRVPDRSRVLGVTWAGTASPTLNRNYDFPDHN